MTSNMASIRDELKLDLISYHSERRLSHLGSCLSSLDILTALFWGPLKETDHFILSKGHAVSLLYLILNKKGLISNKELTDSCRDGSIFGAHPPFHQFNKHPWWGFGTGSLGYGLGLACGVALGKKIRNASDKVYVLLSEGDLNEGSCWEALHFAVNHKLNNLVVLLDHNQVQALGSSNAVFPLDHLPVTLEKMGWHVDTQDGHDLLKIDIAQSTEEKPKFIIFKTQKNRHIERFLSPLEAHYKYPDPGFGGFS